MPSSQLLFFLVVLVGVISLTYALVLRRRNRKLLLQLSDVMHKKSEIGNFLSIFAKNLQTVEEIEDSMNRTAHYLTDLIGANALCIFVLSEDGHLRASGIAGPFPPLHKSPDYVMTKPRYILESLRREKITPGEGIIGQVAQDGESLLIEDGSEDQRIAALDNSIPIETLMAVPMKRDGKILGVICAVNNRLSAKSFSPEQFSTLKFMADQIILAHNIVRTYANLSRQQRLAQELDFARQLQASLLPKQFPEWEPFGVYAFSRSAKEVSGDFYDFIEVDEYRLLVTIGDACGKGIPACMLMAMTRSFIRANVERFESLNSMIRELNNNLFRDTGDERFVTVAFCLLDRREKTVEYARAGHTELLVHIPGHKVRKIFPDGTALGLLPTEIAGDCDVLNFSFLPEMSLLCFTDGLTEALNEEDEEFGIERLSEIFSDSFNRQRTAQQAIERSLQAVDSFSKTDGQNDDQTMVIISHR